MQDAFGFEELRMKIRSVWSDGNETAYRCSFSWSEGHSIPQNSSGEQETDREHFPSVPHAMCAGFVWSASIFLLLAKDRRRLSGVRPWEGKLARRYVWQAI
jgi:hypothetical protein